MNWKPSMKDKKYLDLILDMTVACLMEDGTADRTTYIENLSTACEHMEREAE